MSNNEIRVLFDAARAANQGRWTTIKWMASSLTSFLYATDTEPEIGVFQDHRYPGTRTLVGVHQGFSYSVRIKVA